MGKTHARAAAFSRQASFRTCFQQEEKAKALLATEPERPANFGGHVWSRYNLSVYDPSFHVLISWLGIASYVYRIRTATHLSLSVALHKALTCFRIVELGSPQHADGDLTEVQGLDRPGRAEYGFIFVVNIEPGVERARPLPSAIGQRREMPAYGDNKPLAASRAGKGDDMDRPRTADRLRFVAAARKQLGVLPT